MWLATGGTAKKFNINFLDKQPNGRTESEYAKIHRCYLDCSYNTIYLKICLYFKENDMTCFYEDKSVYMGNSKDNMSIDTLKSIEYFDHLKKSYSVDNQKAIKNEIEELEDKINELKRNLVIY